jgi:hypothetical protein
MLIRYARVRNRQERLVLVLVALASLVDDLVCVGSLGFLSTDLRPWVLFGRFADWADRFIGE